MSKCVNGLCPIKKAGIKGVESVKKNSPAIFTSIAIVGVVGTTVMAVKATPKAMELIWDAKADKMDMLGSIDGDINNIELEPKEILELTWKLYLPVIGMGTVTIASIIAAHKIHTTRNLAIAGLYSITESTLKEYQSKVIETIGENKERKIKDEVRKDRVADTYSGDAIVLSTKDGDVLMLETLSGRYFKGNVENIRKAQNDLNERIFAHMYADLNEFYDLIGLPHTHLGNGIGWSVDNFLSLDMSSAAITKDGEPCIVIDYMDLPDARFR